VEDLQGRVLSDGGLLPRQLGLELAQRLRDGGPWGQHFPEPVFDGSFMLLDQRLVGGRHLKLKLAPLEEPALCLDAIWFNIDPAQWPQPGIDRARVAYRLDVNEFRGFINLQLMVEHIDPI
jgi:single-stranded-DNA-specific exonuclease